jgi:putative ABC transport system permease protein
MKPDYKNWMPKGMITGIAAGAALVTVFFFLFVLGVFPFPQNIRIALSIVFGIGMIVLFAFLVWVIALYKAFDYNGSRQMSRQIIEGTADYVKLPEGGRGLDVGCGSGALTIACAKRNPKAYMLGIDRWGKEYASFSNTIDNESSVIGTLRTSGYTRVELIRHYMTMPVIVTVIGAGLGNLAGYTVFKDIVIKLYYNSYSLPEYETVWSPSALIKTTVIPLVLMFFINLFVISSKLRLSPLRFLRHDLKKKKRQKAVRLPKWSFLRRFRLRVILQNIPDYIVLVVGVILIEVMLCFAFGFPDSLDYYAETAPEMLFTENQYLLTGMKDDEGEEITTDTPGAEHFNSTTLQQEKSAILSEGGFGGGSGEDVTVYGVEKDSAYIDIDEELKDGEVFLSEAYAKKYGFGKGDTISLSEKYEEKSYDFTVAGIYPYEGAVAVFMPIDNFNRIFEKDDGAFAGFFSDEKITDIDDRYIASVMTKKDITKVTDQLQHSMGDFFAVFQYVLLVLAIVLIYLLTKIIIEKNENAISMSKILGFQNGEIASIYMLPTAITVLIFTGISFVIGYYIMALLFRMSLGPEIRSSRQGRGRRTLPVTSMIIPGWKRSMGQMGQSSTRQEFFIILRKSR